MNAEKQIIGSLLLDSSRIDEMHLINSEMFVDSILGKIFSIYEHADGKEVNQLVIIPKIVSDFLTEQKAMQLLADIVASHDSGISDRSSVEAIYDSYRTRRFDEFINRVRLEPGNIDKTINDFQNTLDDLKKIDDDNKPKSLSELAATYKDEYFKEKGKEKYYIGFDKIDKAIGGLDGGDTIILAARPGIGKSALALQIIRKFGREGLDVGYFNMEMGEKQIYERSVASSSGIDMTRIRLANCFLHDEKEKFDEGNRVIDEEKNVFIITDASTIRKIRQKVREYHFQIIVVDYLQLIQPEVKRSSRAVEVGEISRGLKAIAKEFNIPVIALSQLNRVSAMSADKEPSMSELRESGDIEQDASVILMLWNPNANDAYEKKLKVEKSRNGFTDRMKLYFDGKHMNFSSIDVNEGFKKVQEGELPWN